METFLNLFFEAGTWLVPAVVLAILLVIAWIGRADRFFLPRTSWKRALDAVLLVLLVLSLFAAYFAVRVERALTARVARIELRLVSNGAVRRIADYRGKLVVLNLWATWCGPCREEMPGFSRLAEAHRAEDMVVLAATDETVDEIRQYERETAPILAEAATFRDAQPPEGGIEAFTYHGRPVTVVLDREGSVRRLLVGAQSYDALDRAVRARL